MNFEEGAETEEENLDDHDKGWQERSRDREDMEIEDV
jgi:hypothetical protein